MVKALFLDTCIYRTSRVTYHIRRANAMPFTLLTQMSQHGVTPSFENKSLDDSKNNLMQDLTQKMHDLWTSCGM